MTETPDRMLVVGASGFLGRALCDLPVEGFERIPASRSGERHVRIDVTDADSVHRVIQDVRPAWVVNTAAMTSVDGCEHDPKEAFRVHVQGTRHLAEACEGADAALVTLSTNYVFDGRTGPYAESAPTVPMNVYGRTKLESESVALDGTCRGIVVRTAVLYGYRPHCRPNFVTWATQALLAGTPIRVVTDEWANPTRVDELARFILALCRTDFDGIVHFGGLDFLTRYEMIRTMCKRFDLNPDMVTPVRSSELKQAAPRPIRAGLKVDLAGSVCPVRMVSFDANLQELSRDYPGVFGPSM